MEMNETDSIVGNGKISTWPHLVTREAAIGLFIFGLLVLFSLAYPLNLLPPAEPSSGEVAGKAPWFFVGLQEMLYHIQPEFAAAFFPICALLFLIAVPYVVSRSIPIGRWNSIGTKIVWVGIWSAISIVLITVVIMPFYAQAILTTLFAVWSVIAFLKPNSRIAGICGTEMALAYLLVSYLMWTLIGEFLRTPDWRYIWAV
jgi:hypothetical protein